MFAIVGDGWLREWKPAKYLEKKLPKPSYSDFSIYLRNGSTELVYSNTSCMKRVITAKIKKLHTGVCVENAKKIASEMPVPYSLGKKFSTP